MHTVTSPRHALTLMSGIREATIPRSCSDTGVFLSLVLTGTKFRDSKVLSLSRLPGKTHLVRRGPTSLESGDDWILLTR